MTAVIFTGPTLRSEQRETASNLEIEWRPPAKRGDIYRIASKADTSVIGLIDGYFGNVPSVLHKEILWALDRGCAVFGAASMGALRAAELHPFGMVGIGAIFRDFASGRLTRDDEVAIEHGPAELNFPSVSEALVNIRYTLAKAVASGKILEVTSAELIEIAAETFYTRRSLRDCIDLYNAHGGNRIPAATCTWILENRVDQKMEDGLELLAAIKTFQESGRMPHRLSFEFQETGFFAEFRATMDNPIVRDFT